MSEIDPISLDYLLARETKLKFPLGLDNFEEVKHILSESQTSKIMFKLGEYLGELHKVKGENFGNIDSSLLDSYKLKGSHETWYGFLMDRFQERFSEMDQVREDEKKTGDFRTNLSQGNRKLMYELLDRKDQVAQILENHKDILNSVVSPRFLNGNVYTKNITLENGEFQGLSDFHRPLLGDPIWDLAYFSIMPGCGEHMEFVLEGWKKEIVDENLDKKLHLYRLLESYRKIIKRYIKHRYLEDYPEPLQIAREELSYYNIK